MKLAVFGTGYVGLVTGVCFAEFGNQVTGVDINAARIETLTQGKSPIYEPGLTDLLLRHLREKRLHFTLDAKSAIENSEIIFIAVGTPPKDDGSADLQYVDQVAKTIGQYANGPKVVVNKSTVPVGTADRVKAIIQAELKNRGCTFGLDVVSNPEFLKEGTAVTDCMRPDRVIIGTDSDRAFASLKALYAPFIRNHDRLMRMHIRSAELTKYAANAMLATKISFMNEMSQIADRVGADIEEVRVGIGSDSRIGYSFIYPGCGYGGSCFPKDVGALRKIAESAGYGPDLLAAVENINHAQKQVLFQKIQHYFKGDLAGKTIALWGLAFKPKTDDIREASSLALMDALFAAGARVRAYDPKAMEHVAALYKDNQQLTLVSSTQEALAGADALAIVTEWAEFRSPSFDEIKTALKYPVIFDGRNLYEPAYLKSLGFTYYCIGRPTHVA